MLIELKKIKIRDLFDGYKNDDENDDVVGYGGMLNIRPKFQRQFVYNEKQQEKVIDTIRKGFPLNVMYWVKANGKYELLDGQQRTISICEYINNEYSVKINNNEFNFHNLTQKEQNEILDYELMIYICEGDEKEKLDWFETINIAGEKLNHQEILNALYSGNWVTDAKKYFSKNGCPAYDIASEYMSGTPIRQDYLETAIKWICDKKMTNDKYMSNQPKDSNASELWLYFNKVISWAKVTFPKKRKEKKSVEWGYLYNQYGEIRQDANKLEEEIARLMQDDDVTKKSGIYAYVLSKNEKYLNIRAFTENMKRETYERQKGICPICGKHYEIEEMEADHITPWCEGGKTNADNCQMLCKECNRRKSNN